MQGRKSIMTALSDAVVQVITVQNKSMDETCNFVEEMPCSQSVLSGIAGISAIVDTKLITTYSTSTIPNATSKSHSQESHSPPRLCPTNSGVDSLRR